MDVGGEMDATSMRVDVIVIVEQKSSRSSRRGGERRAREDADARRRLARTTITTGGPVFREDGGRGKGDGGELGETVIQGERP